jgi:hypothetical protein
MISLANYKYEKKTGICQGLKLQSHTIRDGMLFADFFTSATTSTFLVFNFRYTCFRHTYGSCRADCKTMLTDRATIWVDIIAFKMHRLHLSLLRIIQSRILDHDELNCGIQIKFSSYNNLLGCILRLLYTRNINFL